LMFNGIVSSAAIDIMAINTNTHGSVLRVCKIELRVRGCSVTLSQLIGKQG
jgi:hypothetical protein